MSAEGLVVKTDRGLWIVDIGTEFLMCAARGKLRSAGTVPLTGDRVEVISLGGGKGSVERVLPRKNAFVRPSAANVDLLVILASAVEPVTDPYLVDRMTVIAEMKDCRPLVVLNKCDLARSPELHRRCELAGIPYVETSAVTGEGLTELKERLHGTFCVFTGNSGVGKSSLLNALRPELNLKTGTVSEKLGRGRHTTRSVEIFTLSEDIRAADTPGFAAFEGEEISLEMKRRLPELFPEFREYLGTCRFPDCAHDRDAGCAVRAAVEAGKIHEGRYASYLRLREELRDLKEWSHSD